MFTFDPDNVVDQETKYADNEYTVIHEWDTTVKVGVSHPKSERSIGDRALVRSRPNHNLEKTDLLGIGHLFSLVPDS